MRVLACPRSPRKITSWPERMAFSSWGMTVSSYPIMPGKKSSFLRILEMRFLRISALTERALYFAFFNSPTVWGFLVFKGLTTAVSFQIPVWSLSVTAYSFSLSTSNEQPPTRNGFSIFHL